MHRRGPARPSPAARTTPSIDASRGQRLANLLIDDFVMLVVDVSVVLAIHFAMPERLPQSIAKLLGLVVVLGYHYLFEGLLGGAPRAS